MMTSRTVIGSALCVSLSAFANQAGPGENGAAQVAEINGQRVTRAELEQKQAAKLLQARYQHYQAEREALDQLIDQRLVEMEAAREHLSVEQLLQREVTDKVKGLADDQIQVFYEGLRTEEPFASAREKIIGTIKQIRTTKARAAFLQSLRAKSTVRIALLPPAVDLAIGTAPIRGPQNAPVVVVEFADYECPYCQAIHPEIKKLQNEFGNKVAFVFKDFPLPMHPTAQKAAEGARCAGVQGKFWEFQDLLFTKGKKFDVAQLKEHGRTLGLDAARFDQCLDSNEQAAAVQADLAQAHQLGLTGTPAFFINGHYLSGAVKYATLREIVEQQLAASDASARTLPSLQGR